MINYDYVVEVSANVSAKEAFLKFVDAHLMKDWQPNLLRIETEKGLLFQQGSSGYLVYQAGDHEMKMKITVNLCEGTLFDATYEVPGVVNRCINQFKKKDDKLLWKMIVNFKIDGDEAPDKVIFETKTRLSMMQFIDYLDA